MNGAQAIAALQKRLGEDGMAVPATRTAQLEDALTDSRDMIVQAMSESAPVVVKEILTLVVNVGNDRLYDWPGATKDPLRVIDVRAVTTKEPLLPSATLNMDQNHYRWRSLKQLELADGVEPPGGVEIEAVLHRADITSATTEAAMGLPTPLHRLIVKGAHWMLATVDEATDGQGPARMFDRELARFEKIYGSYDDNQGAALRAALLAAYGAWTGDTIY